MKIFALSLNIPKLKSKFFALNFYGKRPELKFLY